MHIGIVGNGVVGNALAKCYYPKHEVRIYDIDWARSTNSLGEVLDTDIIFVCLPTPQKKDSLDCDLSALDSFFNFKMGSANREEVARGKSFVLKSTVPIGTTKRLASNHCLRNLVHSPEFLTARTAVEDAQEPRVNIIGVTEAQTGNANLTAPLWRLYRETFPLIPIRYMTSDESEAVKLFMNGFFAVKVAYFNEINLLAKKLGLDWGVVTETMIEEGRLLREHTMVPGPDGKFGFGGACLPKDLRMLVHQIEEHEDEVHGVCAAAHIRNMSDRKRTE